MSDQILAYQTDDNQTQVKRKIKFYHPDAIISEGYRVNSKKGAA